MLEKLRCMHRHSPLTHPNCFKNALVTSVADADQPWWVDKRIAYLDIETSNLPANFGFMLSWCLKYRGDKHIRYSLISKKEIFDYKFDRRLVKELIDELHNVDIIVTYFGKGFDAKFVRTRALYWGLKFPAYGTLFHWDMYYHVKRHMKLHRYSLEVATNFLGIEGKTAVDWEIWNLAKYGHPPSLDNVLEHNKQDVIILEKLHDRLGDFSKWMKQSI